MKKSVYLGHIQSTVFDAKTLVLAESPEHALAKILATFSEGLGKLYREADVTVLPFAVSY